MRNLSFKSPAELKSYLEEKAPWAAYVGAAYQSSPQKGKPVPSLQIKKRELVFDLDLTDYNDLRDCGTGKSHYCEECWPLVRNAAVFINETLKKDFGFGKIKWFFSGRRGLHAWVLGEKSQNLSKEAREAIIEYLSPRQTRSRLSRRFRFRVMRILGKGITKEGNNLNDLFQKLPRVDRKVTIDLHRLMRIPGSLHQATGRPNTPVENLEDFYPDVIPFVWDLV